MAFTDKQNGRTYYETYRAENKEKIAASNKAYRLRNAERIKQRQLEYRGVNREAILVRQKQYRDSERGKAYHAAYMHEYLADPIRRMHFLCRGLKKRSAEKSIPYDPELRNHLCEKPPTHCACCFRELNYQGIGRGQNVRFDSPSLDRFINAEGYTIANVRVICMRCNEIKRDATVEELETVIAYIRRGNECDLGKP